MGKKRELKEYEKLLQKHADQKHVVKLCREFNNGESSLFGCILGVSKNLLLLQETYDFDFDGYAVVPMNGFDSVRHNKFDKASTAILKAEGVFEAKYGLAHNIDIAGWQAVFSSLFRLDLHVIVECEHIKKPSFTIGPVVKAGKSSVSIQYYDATGLLNIKPTKIPYEDISLLRFGDRYSTTFRKYVKEPKVKSNK